nr:uncharacterized protein LOC116156565 [Camelus dromedarius]
MRGWAGVRGGGGVGLGAEGRPWGTGRRGRRAWGLRAGRAGGERGPGAGCAPPARPLCAAAASPQARPEREGSRLGAVAASGWRRPPGCGAAGAGPPVRGRRTRPPPRVPGVLHGTSPASGKRRPDKKASPLLRPPAGLGGAVSFEVVWFLEENEMLRLVWIK